MEKTNEIDHLRSLNSNANSANFEADIVSRPPPALQLKAKAENAEAEGLENESAQAPFQFAAADPGSPIDIIPANNNATSFQLKENSSESESTEAVSEVQPYQLAVEGGEFPSENPSSNAGDKPPNNTGLPTQLKSGVEALSGYSLDDVNVHYNSVKPAQLQAHAYAQGTDIHLGSGQEKHLPHEAWHVVQQKQGRVQPTTQLKAFNINDDAGLEKEADVMGAKAMQMKMNETSFTQASKTSPAGATVQLARGNQTLTKTRSKKKKKKRSSSSQNDLPGPFIEQEANNDTVEQFLNLPDAFEKQESDPETVDQFLNLPAPQEMHESDPETVDQFLNLPAPQEMHESDPDTVDQFLNLPAPQEMHESDPETVDQFLNLPAPQEMHESDAETVDQFLNLPSPSVEQVAAAPPQVLAVNAQVAINAAINQEELQGQVTNNLNELVQAWEGYVGKGKMEETESDKVFDRFINILAQSDANLAARVANSIQGVEGRLAEIGPEIEDWDREEEQPMEEPQGSLKIRSSLDEKYELEMEQAMMISHYEEQLRQQGIEGGIEQEQAQIADKPKKKKKKKKKNHVGGVGPAGPNALMPGIDLQADAPVPVAKKRRKKKVRKKKQKVGLQEQQPAAGLEVSEAAPNAPGAPPPNYTEEAKRAKISLSKDGRKEMIASNISEAGGLAYSLTNGIGSDIKNDASLTDPQEALAMEPVSLANDAGSLVSGVFELGLGAKSFVEQFRSDDPDLYKLLKSGVGTLQSGADVAWAVSGLVNTKTDSDSSSIASFATGNLSKQAGVVLSLMDTIKGGVDLAKALFGEDSDEFTGSEKFGMLLGELKNMAGLAKSIAGQVKHIWSQIEQVPSGLSDTLPLIDIISAGLTMIMKGVGVVTAAVRYFDSKETQRALAESLAQEHGTTTDVVKNSLKGHEELEAKSVNAQSYKEHNDGKIEHYQKDMEKRKEGLEGKNKVSKKYHNFRIRKDQEQLDKRSVKKDKNAGIIDNIGKEKTLFTKFSGFTSEELNEYGLGKEIQSVNKKMVQRDTALFIAEAPKVAGGIMKLTGVAAAAGAATSGSSTLAKAAIKGRRKIAQVSKDHAGKNEAKGKENKGLFGAVDSNNSMDAKLQKRTRYAMTILRMAADSSSPDLDEVLKQQRAEQMLTNLKNLGVSPGKLFKLNGKPQKQLKMLVEALSKREF